MCNVENINMLVYAKYVAIFMQYIGQYMSYVHTIYKGDIHEISIALYMHHIELYTFNI
jgi:hypothetical protein